MYSLLGADELGSPRRHQQRHLRRFDDCQKMYEVDGLDDALMMLFHVTPLFLPIAHDGVGECLPRQWFEVRQMRPSRSPQHCSTERSDQRDLHLATALVWTRPGDFAGHHRVRGSLKDFLVLHFAQAEVWSPQMLIHSLQTLRTFKNNWKGNAAFNMFAFPLSKWNVHPSHNFCCGFTE